MTRRFFVRSRKLVVESLEQRALLAVSAGWGSALSDTAAQPKFWLVNTNTDSMSWSTTDSRVSLREAITRANEGDVILFSGALKGKSITLCGAELIVDKGITISADSIGSMTINANQRSRVLSVGGAENISVELASLVISGGAAYEGGGIYAGSGSSLTLTNCVISNNSADYGGAVLADTTNLTLTDCSVENNTSDYGSIYAYSGRLTLTGSNVSDNVAKYGGGFFAEGCNLTFSGSSIENNSADTCGGIYVYSGSSLTMTNCEISCNTSDYGSGILLDTGSLTLTDCTISKNNARFGGGIYAKDGTLSLFDCTFTENAASLDSGGGIYAYSGSDLTMTGCTVVGNSADSCGGGIYAVSDSTLSLTNCEVTENSAKSRGGGVCADAGSVLTLDSCTITRNSADLRGGGIYVHSVFPMILSHCTVSGNTAESGGGVLIDSGGYLSITDSDITENSAKYGGGIFAESCTLNLAGCHVAENSASRDSGGGIAAVSSVLTLDCSHITGNSAGYRGGGVYSYSGSLTVTGCTLSNNSSDDTAFNASGGGVCADSATVSLIGCSISENSGGGVSAVSGVLAMDGCTVRSNTAYDGGGIYLYSDTTLIMTNSVVSVNSAQVGGGIFAESGTLALTCCTISDNSALSYGGGISASGSLILADCTISGNTATNFGGGISIDSGDLTLTNCVISGNSASFDSGGGIFAGYSILTLTNCVLAGNSAFWYGGGVFAYSGTQMLTNCTIAGNTALNYNGGGVCVRLESLILQNSIVAQNYAPYDSDIYTSSATVIGGNNIIGFDPGFITAPVFNSGQLVNADSLDLDLSPASWGIDRGNNDYVTANTDYAGDMRVVASWKSNPTVDIGAFEYQSAFVKQPETPSVVVTSNSDVVNDTDGLISLREALLYADYGDTVTFTETMKGKTIILNGIELRDDKNVSIDASSIGGVTINANQKSRVLYVMSDENAPVYFTNIAVTGGRTDYGSGIYADSGVLNLTNCLISKNYADDSGGGLCTNSDCLLTLTNCTVSGNFADYGGGIDADTGTLTFQNCIVLLNTAGESDSDIRSISANLFAYNTLSTFTNWAESANRYVYDPSQPLFAAPANNNYRLAADSQAADKGNNTYNLTEVDLAGNSRISNGIIDLGAYELQYTSPKIQLDPPVILTGTGTAPYVSYGADRHLLQWTAVDGALGYVVSCSKDDSEWKMITVTDTKTIISALPYGADMTYKVKAFGNDIYTNSNWSKSVSFKVCPMDVNNDGDIAGVDRSLVAKAWLSEVGDEEYTPCSDIDADGDVSGLDRSYLAVNWLCETDEENLRYPSPLGAALAEIFSNGELAPDTF